MTEGYGEFYEDDDEVDWEDPEVQAFVEQVEGFAAAQQQQQSQQAWAEAGARFEQRLGRKPTRREIENVMPRVFHHWNGEGDPVDAIQKEWDSYHEENPDKKLDLDTAEGRENYFSELYEDREGKWEPTTTPGKTGDEIAQEKALQELVESGYIEHVEDGGSTDTTGEGTEPPEAA